MSATVYDNERKPSVPLGVAHNTGRKEGMSPQLCVSLLRYMQEGIIALYAKVAPLCKIGLLKEVPVLVKFRIASIIRGL
jgi:hypothetical protein